MFSSYFYRFNTMLPDRLWRLLPFFTSGLLLFLYRFAPENALREPSPAPALFPEGVWAVLCVLAAGTSIWLFERALQALSPGAHAFSRGLYAAVLALTPFFILCGSGASSGMVLLVLVLAVCYQGLHALETRYTWAEFWAALFGGLAVLWYLPLIVLLGPLLLLLAWRLLRTRRWGLFAVFVATLFSMGLVWRVLKPGAGTPGTWSASNFLQKEFFNAAAVKLEFEWPNAVYVLYPFLHPGFCILLPGLWLLAKKTDFRLRSKKVLAAGLFLYLLLLGGLPGQYLPGLLPAYAVLLLLLFPAWDRFTSYGLYFFKRLTLFILCAGVLLQVAALVWFWK